MSTFLIKKNGVERYKLPTPLFQIKSGKQIVYVCDKNKLKI